jgi:hypothetical protein
MGTRMVRILISHAFANMLYRVGTVGGFGSLGVMIRHENDDRQTA